MVCSGTRASADSSRMVISLRLISRLKITVARPCCTEAARARSSARVELWVGIHERPARYMCSALSTCTQRTGTLGIGRTSVMNRQRVVGGAPVACRASFRVSRNTLSAGVNVTL